MRLTNSVSSSKLGAGRVFSAPNLLQTAMPMGGIGADSICLNSYGGLQDYALHHKPATTAHPDAHIGDESAFALLHVKADGDRPAVTKLLGGCRFLSKKSTVKVSEVEDAGTDFMKVCRVCKAILSKRETRSG